MPWAEFDVLADEMKARAFTAKRLWDQQALKAALDSIQEAIAEGQTVREWQEKSWKRLAERFGAPGAVSSHYVDTVFRTNTQSAFADGRYLELFSPEAIRKSPYWMYSSIHDARTRPSHRALEGRVFLKTDPQARRYLPPISFNCRCMAIELTQKDVHSGGYTVTPGPEIAQIPLVDAKGKPLLDAKTGQPLTVGEPPAGWNADRVQGLIQKFPGRRLSPALPGRPSVQMPSVIPFPLLLRHIHLQLPFRPRLRSLRSGICQPTLRCLSPPTSPTILRLSNSSGSSVDRQAPNSSRTRVALAMCENGVLHPIISGKSVTPMPPTRRSV